MITKIKINSVIEVCMSQALSKRKLELSIIQKIFQTISQFHARDRVTFSYIYSVSRPASSLWMNSRSVSSVEGLKGLKALRGGRGGHTGSLSPFSPSSGNWLRWRSGLGSRWQQRMRACARSLSATETCSHGCQGGPPAPALSLGSRSPTVNFKGLSCMCVLEYMCMIELDIHLCVSSLFLFCSLLYAFALPSSAFQALIGTRHTECRRKKIQCAFYDYYNYYTVIFILKIGSASKWFIWFDTV